MTETTLSMREPLSVERVKARDLPYERYVRDYVAKNRPVVIEGAADQWPAREKWTPAFFKERFKSKPVHITYEKQMPFDEFIDAVNASTPEKPGPYMFRLFICDALPELLPDLMPGNDYAFPRRLASPLMPRAWRRPDGYLKLLIGGAGGRFPVMHYDGENMHAAITEIHGDKDCLLFAPEDAPYLYPKSERMNQSQVDDMMKPDLKKYPLLAKAQPYRTIIKPGDTLFVPSRWWHTTRVLGPSVSVCTNMLDATNWDGFVSEVCKSGRSPPRLFAKRAMLTVLGKTLDQLESRVAQLAPVRSAMAKDLREFKPEQYDGAPPY